MSVGHAHSRRNEKHPLELDKIEAEPGFQRMWNRPFRVTTTRQIPDSAGYAVSGDEYFIDVDLHRAILAGSWPHPPTGKVYSLRVPGLTPQDIIECLLLHERTEKTILDADNPINEYQNAHEYATLAEHTKVKAKGGRPVDYERALAPLIAWNQVKPLNNVPQNLSCVPLLDDPDAQDKITIKALQKLGVKDSFKVSKKSVSYGPAKGAEHCSCCSGWESANRQAELSPCRKVDGAVRNSYYCTMYQEMADGQAQQGAPRIQGGGSQDQQAFGNPQPWSSPGGSQPQGLPSSPQGQPAPVASEGVS